MNSLLLRERLNFNPYPTGARSGTLIVSRSNLTGTLNLHSGLNHSIRLEEGLAARKYSVELRALVQECLLREPLQRPAPEGSFTLTSGGESHLIGLD